MMRRTCWVLQIFNSVSARYRSARIPLVQGGTALFFALVLFALVPTLTVGAEENPPMKGFDLEGSDARALAIADQVMERLGGRQSWDSTRYITWRFFGRRLHVWDKWSGNIRFEQGEQVVLMNIHTRQGRVWESGVEVADPDTLEARLQHGYRAWINDSYWLVMPYKLKDSGVTLKYGGEGATADGRPADILALTFKDVGVTPQNKYDVYVDRENHLVRQWAFYAQVEDQEPGFVVPWANWQSYDLAIRRQGQPQAHRYRRIR